MNSAINTGIRRLHFSYYSDKASEENSYNGASIYKSFYNTDFEIIKTEVPKF